VGRRVDGGFGSPGPPLWLRRFTKRQVNRHWEGVQPEAVQMYIERGWMVAVAEEALNMKADGKEAWCISWLQWFWQEEIERAIWDVQQGRS
jgi:hypothetical protein